MVEVFRTNVEEAQEADKIVRQLLEHFNEHKINFDLEDCDRILRIEGKDIRPEHIIQYLNASGYKCEMLDG